MTTSPLRLRGALVGGVAASLLLAGCGGGFSGGSTGSNTAASTQTGPVKLTVMIGSSGDAETNAVKAAASAWAAKTGNTVDVVAASDLTQQLGQGFAGGTPPDVFYTGADVVGDYAKAGYLYAYGKDVASAGFLPALEKAFTYKGTLQCAPKDYSTLALVINTDMWTAAGLTDADIPKDWAGLETVAAKLTKNGVTGLVFSGEHDRVGVFLKQAGGWLVNADGTQVTADTDANAAGLAEVKKLLASGNVKFAKAVDAGWGGEAIGKGKTAMTIEGNWISGAMTKDYPTIKYKVVELPAGPAGKGTLAFTNCWGIAAKSKNQAAAVDLVKAFISTDQQMAFAKAFGVMPSTTEANAKYKAEYPANAAFAAGGDYGQGPVNFPGWGPVKTAYNNDIANLANVDPKSVLGTLQKNATAAMSGS
ncbi:MAG TPA: extracellular solute-binding protein [Dermatophilaceae bacterium]|nr:extracellular solute-binding protein [Dermatophilaceae bacterium]